MIILTIKTNGPLAEIGICNGTQIAAYDKWESHRRLAETIHRRIEKILNKSSISWKDIGGIVVYKGSGSFTGLRIGIAVANAIAAANDIQIVSQNGKNWRQTGIKRLLTGQNDSIALPEYGGPANVSKPKK